MKTRFISYYQWKELFFSLILALVLFSSGCKKNGSAPLVTTLRPYESGIGEATCGGVIYSEGDDAISEKGICWATHSPATIDISKTKSGSGNGNFTSKMTNLKPLTKYFIRAYATNKYGTSYGSEEILTTLETPPLPVVFGRPSYSVTLSTAISGGTVLIGVGEAPIIRTGFCWSKTSLPTINDANNTCTVNPFGSFTGTLTGLEANTTYSVRAYATNYVGTSYGEIEVMKTMYGTVTDVDNNTYYTVAIGNQVWMAENLRVTKYRNGTPIPLAIDNTLWLTSGGYCYYSNNSGNAKYGALYNWKAVNNTSLIAPAGWHVPTRAEYLDLISFLGGAYQASTKLKTSAPNYWSNPESNTNSSQFSALPGGNRSSNGYYSSLNNLASFWTKSYAPQASVYVFVLNSVDFADVSSFDIDGGYSLRLIKD